MFNFFHTLCVCILALFGWYQPIESAAQQPIDAQNKNAISYSSSILLSIGDLLDEQRFMGFQKQFSTLFGENALYDLTTYTYNVVEDNSDECYLVNVSLSQRIYDYIPEASYYCNVFRVSKSVVAPAAGNTGYYMYTFTLMYDINTPTLQWYCGYYMLSGDAYFSYPTYLKGLYFCGINPIGLGNNSDVFNYGVNFASGTGNDLYTLYRLFSYRYEPDTNTLIQEASESGYNLGYNQGNIDGYQNGYQLGNIDGYSTGFSDGNTQGYQTGYAVGLSDGQQYDDTAFTIFTGIIEVGLLPVNIFLQMFNYEIFGINISGVVSALLTISIVIIIVRFLLGKKDD